MTYIASQDIAQLPQSLHNQECNQTSFHPCGLCESFLHLKTECMNACKFAQTLRHLLLKSSVQWHHDLPWQHLHSMIYHGHTFELLGAPRLMVRWYLNCKRITHTRT